MLGNLERVVKKHYEPYLKWSVDTTAITDMTEQAKLVATITTEPDFVRDERILKTYDDLDKKMLINKKQRDKEKDNAYLGLFQNLTLLFHPIESVEVTFVSGGPPASKGLFFKGPIPVGIDQSRRSKTDQDGITETVRKVRARWGVALDKLRVQNLSMETEDLDDIIKVAVNLDNPAETYRIMKEIVVASKNKLFHYLMTNGSLPNNVGANNHSPYPAYSKSVCNCMLVMVRILILHPEMVVEIEDESEKMLMVNRLAKVALVSSQGEEVIINMLAVIAMELARTEWWRLFMFINEVVLPYLSEYRDCQEASILWVLRVEKLVELFGPVLHPVTSAAMCLCPVCAKPGLTKARCPLCWNYATPVWELSLFPIVEDTSVSYCSFECLNAGLPAHIIDYKHVIPCAHCAAPNATVPCVECDKRMCALFCSEQCRIQSGNHYHNMGFTFDRIYENPATRAVIDNRLLNSAGAANVARALVPVGQPLTGKQRLVREFYNAGHLAVVPGPALVRR